MAYVLACLEDNGLEFDFIDVTTTRDWGDAVRELLVHNDYYAVATGGMISFVSFYKEVVALAREYAPGVPVVLGGHIVKDGSDDLLFRIVGVDYAILGEAEVSMPGFLAALKAGTTDFTGFEGVVFRSAEGEVVRNRHTRFKVGERNILPAWHHFDWAYYVENCMFCFLGKHLRYIPILSGRGCTGKCGFCSPSIGGFMKRPVEHVIEEIEHLIANYSFDNLCFLNEMFYPTTDMVREFCAAYMKVANRKTWFVQVRVDIELDVETLVMMKQAGCIAISAGIESGSPDVLKTMRKGITVEQIRRLARNCREAGLPLTGTFIIGYEGETEDDLVKTIDLVIDEDISTGEALLFMYQGTAVYEKALRKGLIKDEEEQLNAISGQLFRPNAPVEFCNMTAMSTRDFFTVATREVRRYYRHLFRKYYVRDMTMDIRGTWRWTKMTMKGRCEVCGIEVEHEYKMFGGEFLGSLGPGVDRMVICPKCFKHLVFDPYSAVNDMGMREHLDSVRARLSSAEGVVIYGVGSNLNFLLRSDLYGLDYEDVRGVFTPSPVDYENYLTYPVLDEAELCSAKADVVLCVDDSVPESEIAALFKARGRLVPEVVYLTSREFRDECNRKKCLVYRVNQVVKKLFGSGVRELLASWKFWN
jgi:Fe-S oxidoreductase